MKRLVSGFVGAGIVWCAVLAGCLNAFGPPGRAAVPQGRGRVTVTIGGAAGGTARTIAPAESAFTKYTLAFSGPEAAAPLDASGGSAVAELAPGSWTVSAAGYVSGSDVPAAEGSALITVLAGNNGAVTILLGPKAGGAQGTFSYSLKIPDNLDRAELIISTAAGGAGETIPLGYNASGITGSRNLDPGEYLARVRLVRGAGSAAVYAGLAEALHIYSGLDSALPFKAYTAEDFKTAVGALDLTGLVSAPAVYAAPDAAFAGGGQYTGSVAWKESDGVTAVTGVFDTDTVYKAVVTLAAAAERTFAGVAENSFAYSGAAVSNAADSGVVTITFPATPPCAGIDTAEKLAKIGADSGYPLDGKYKLTADLTLSNWVPIGGDTAPFAGVFDGNNRTITLQSFAAAALSGKKYLGVFGSVKGSSAASRAELKDLAIIASVNDTSTNTDSQFAGLLAGYAENTQISGIALSGSFRFTSAMYAFTGGAAGRIAGSEISNCHNTAALTTVFSRYCGGIVGYLDDSAAGSLDAGTIENCSFSGTIDATCWGNTAYMGGIAGYVSGSAAGNPTLIRGCRAEGTVQGISTGPGPSYPVYAGGIAGETKGGTIAQSYFNGTIKAYTSDVGAIGGIAGIASGLIEDCWSSGELVGISRAGGIVGYSTGYIVRCYAAAEVSCIQLAGSGMATSFFAGGIAGYARDATAYCGACVALNPQIAAESGTYIHRVAGYIYSGAVLDNNHAWSGMTISGGTYTPDTGADKTDGANIGAAQPGQDFYEGLEWDFTAGAGVWAMGADGYPKLQ